MARTGSAALSANARHLWTDVWTSVGVALAVVLVTLTGWLVLDPLIHAPTRLHLLTTLSAVSEAEFTTLRAVLDVSDSVLSKHVSALVEAGYLHSRKGVHAGRRTTWVGLTPVGRQALRDHVAAVRLLIDAVE